MNWRRPGLEHVTRLRRHPRTTPETLFLFYPRFTAGAAWHGWEKLIVATVIRKEKLHWLWVSCFDAFLSLSHTQYLKALLHWAIFHASVTYRDSKLSRTLLLLLLWWWWWPQASQKVELILLFATIAATMLSTFF